MKSRLELVVPHSVLSGESLVEVSYNGRLLCCIYGADGPGIRVVNRHSVLQIGVDSSSVLRVVEILFPQEEDA